MRYELWLGLRYLLARRRERFISVIALLSIGGVALGVMALLLVLSVMSGFDHDLKEKLVGANAHLTVAAVAGPVHDVESVIRAIASTEHVVGVSPFVTGQAIIRMPDRALGVVVRGLDGQREARVTKLHDYLVFGHLPTQDHEAVIGSELASYLQLAPGDPLSLISPADGKLHELVISGIFRSGMYEYDASLVGVTLARAQQVFALSGVVSGVTVRLDELERASDVKRALVKHLGPAYEVNTWMEQNQILFDALKLEKLTMFLILTLIVIVAAANIVSTLIMMVIEKTRDIGILKSIGATSASVRWIFTWQGLIIGVVGTCLGLLGALGILWLQETYQLVRLPSSIYYLDYLPVRIESHDWSLTVLAALIISLLATVYPARQAAKLAPVEALRYE